MVVDAAYRSDEGLPWVLPVVRNVEMTMAADETLNHEYLAIDGLSQYSKAASCLLLGEESEAVLQDRVGLSPHIQVHIFICTIKLWKPNKVCYIN